MRVGVPDSEIPQEELSQVLPAVVAYSRGNDSTSHSTALCHMTKTQLLALAAEHGIEVRSSVKKPLLIEILEEAGL
mgnify:CR=1 FL=1